MSAFGSSSALNTLTTTNSDSLSSTHISWAVLDNLLFTRCAPRVINDRSHTAYAINALINLETTVLLIFKCIASDNVDRVLLIPLLQQFNLVIDNVVGDVAVMNALLDAAVAQGGADQMEADSLRDVAKEFAANWRGANITPTTRRNDVDSRSNNPLDTQCSVRDTLLLNSASISKTCSSVFKNPIVIDLPLGHRFLASAVDHSGAPVTKMIVALIVALWIAVITVVVALSKDALLVGIVASAALLAMVLTGWLVVVALYGSAQNEAAWKRMHWPSHPILRLSDGPAPSVPSPRTSIPHHGAIQVMRATRGGPASIEGDAAVMSGSSVTPIVQLGRPPSFRSSSIGFDDSSSVAGQKGDFVKLTFQVNAAARTLRIRTRVVLELLPIIVLERLHVVVWSDVMATSTGIPAIEVIGKRIASLVDDESNRQLLNARNLVIHNQRRPKSFKLTFLSASQQTQVVFTATITQGYLDAQSAPSLVLTGQVSTTPAVDPATVVHAFGEQLQDAAGLALLSSSSAGTASALSASSVTTDSSFLTRNNSSSLESAATTAAPPTTFTPNSSLLLPTRQGSASVFASTVLSASARTTGTLVPGATAPVLGADMASLRALMRTVSNWETVDRDELVSSLVVEDISRLDVTVADDVPLSFSCNTRALREFVAEVVKRTPNVMERLRLALGAVTRRQASALQCALSIVLSSQTPVGMENLLETQVVATNLTQLGLVTSVTDRSVSVVFPIFVPTKVAHAAPDETTQFLDGGYVSIFSDNQHDSTGSLGKEDSGSYEQVPRVVVVHEPLAVYRRHIVQQLRELGHTVIIVENEVRLSQLMRFDLRRIDLAIIEVDGAVGEHTLREMRKWRIPTIAWKSPPPSDAIVTAIVPSSIQGDVTLQKPCEIRQLKIAIGEAMKHGAAGYVTHAEAAHNVCIRFREGHHQQGTYVAQRALGRGAQGDVDLVKQERTGILAARKTLIFRGEARRDDAEHAISRLLDLEHPNVMQYYCFAGSGNALQIYMEYCEGETLGAYMKRSYARLDAVEIALITGQVLAGLEHLHAHGIAHRDLKPDNIMFFSERGGVKIVDYGFAPTAAPSAVGGDDAAGGGALAGAAGGGGGGGAMYGTPRYMSPEATGRCADPCVDIWALGVIVAELFNALPQPLVRATAISMVNLYVEMNANPKATSPLAADPRKMTEDSASFINLCLQRDLRRRPSARALLFHPFIVKAKLLVGATVPFKTVSPQSTPHQPHVKRGETGTSEFTAGGESDSEDDGHGTVISAAPPPQEDIPVRIADDNW